MQANNIRTQGLALVIICSVAVAVRLLFMQDWLNYDECQHFLVAKSPFWDDFVREFRIRAHPPLTYIFMKPFVLLNSSAYSAKMLSLICGIISIIIISFTLQRGGVTFWPAQVATVFLSMIPLFIMQSVEVRQYSLCLVFVWLSIYLYFRFYEDLTQKAFVHMAIAFAQLLAIVTEYSAIFHLLSLSIIIYLPLTMSLIRQKKISKLFLFCLPQFFVFLSALLLFKWQFANTIPTYGHTEPYMFKESLMSLQTIYGFFLERFSDFTNGILPNPWGISLFLLLFLPFLPLWNNKILAKQCRVFSCYVMISIGLVFIGALFQRFPFGGTPRHTVSILPGILVAWVLIIYLIISEISSNKKIRVAVSVFVCIALVPAYVTALALPDKSQQSYQEIFKSSGFDKYKKSPGSIVANWRGRSILSWWLLPDETPRLAYNLNYQIHVHNYGRTRVVEQDGLHNILNVTNHILEQERQCWIVLSFLGNADESDRICYFLKNAFQKDPHIHLDISQNTSFNNTILIKVNKNIEKD